MSKNGLTTTVDKTKSVVDALRTLTTKHTLVGVPTDENHRDGESPFGNAQIGYVQENGSEAARIPPRPHLVPGVAAVSGRCADIMAKGAAATLSGDFGAFEKSLEKAGLVAQSSVKDTIRKGVGFKELSEWTISNRVDAGFKGTKPLIWTGQYLNSITYVVRKK